MSAQVAVVRAAATLIVHLESASAVDVFTPLCAGFMRVVGNALRSGDTDAARDAIGYCVDLADVVPRFFKEPLGAVVGDLSAVAGGAGRWPDALRHICVELLTTLAEKAAAMVRKLPKNGFLRAVLPSLLTMMTELEEMPLARWEGGSKSEMNALSNPNVGEETLLRIAEAIGPKRFVPSLMELVAVALRGPGWREVHAGVRALVAIAHVAEASREDLVGYMAMLLPHVQVRVCVCACVCVRVFVCACVCVCLLVSGGGL